MGQPGIPERFHRTISMKNSTLHLTFANYLPKRLIESSISLKNHSWCSWWDNNTMFQTPSKEAKSSSRDGFGGGEGAGFGAKEDAQG
ncbi:MAG: hypothetical protein NZP34_12300, partial [Caldilineales bacterium]|nr:hypothetical protein [Caldilineales bacterium]